jgi:hypothetical protein
MRRSYNLLYVLLLMTAAFVISTGCEKEEEEDKSIKISSPISGNGTEIANPLLYIRGKFGNEEFQFVHHTDGQSYTEDQNKLFLSMHEEEDINESATFLIMLYRFNLSTISLPWETSTDISYPNPYAIMVLRNDKVSFESSQLAGRDLHIRLDKIEGDTISGVFNGDFYISNLPVTVTNGEFRVPFERR